ncbi:hypothetical protein [Psychroflexus aestuariivivens]|uniref:hypothetical protein n=1 Tax=Psychroflexus aestuariivivens TaxID=1795040 RepID=UPI000FDB893F|nr:hypothetical protein [Psychroflexus aestuariivivens]
MKRLFLFAIVVFSSVSCFSKTIDNDIKSELEKTEFRNITQNDFEKLRKEIFRMLNSDDVSLNDFHQFYREKIKPSKDENLMNIAFYTLVEKGLLEDSTDSQIQIHYLEEQQNLSQNLPNIKRFYDLLIACESDFTKKELFAIEQSFYDKNYDKIVNQEWDDETKQQKRKVTLMHNSKLFRRYLRHK